ncbi:MAG TPA: DUF6062 family protein [Ktedonobacteraceae bacterium]|jgi:hypothetical protein
MPKTREYQALFEACAQEGCAICHVAQQSTHRYLATWKYELFTDVEIRNNLRKSRGFCHTHTWALAHMGASLQLAQAYRDIITDMTEHLQGAEVPGNLLRRIFDTPSPQREHAPCPACLHQQKAEQYALDTLRKALPDDEFYERFASSSGLCLEHFDQACTGNNGDWLVRLKKAQVACLQRLEKQLSELIRKHDYRFKEEERGAEMISWKWAAGLVAGEE